ncbi:MAG: oxidoreductase [Micrococcales bacterium]|nr:oxidoreductase [Micrococcales bacterium]
MGDVVLVTGATSGIGAATAVALAGRGYTVYGTGRRAERLAKLELRGVKPLVMDMTDAGSADAAVAAVLEAEGRIDVLVNNAGYGEYGAIEDVTMDRALRQLEVNVLGHMRLAKLVLPGMRERGAGRIVNVTSMGGRFTTAFGGWYHASKYAMEALSDALRQEVAPFGIEVIVIEPGTIRTEWSIVASANSAESSGAGVYAARAGKVTGILNRPWARRWQSGPGVVARTIVRAVEARRPRTRYSVGMGAKPVLLMRRLLPDRALDRVLKILTG